MSRHGNYHRVSSMPSMPQISETNPRPQPRPTRRASIETNATNVTAISDSSAAIIYYEPDSYMDRSGWRRMVIRRVNETGKLGYCGSPQFIKLSDGRIIFTNDLNAGDWFRSVKEPGALFGQQLQTCICQPKSIEAVDYLMSRLDPRTNMIQRCVDMRKEYEECERFAYQIPALKLRQYETKKRTLTYSSPEGACITHFKIGLSQIQAFKEPEQLMSVDPCQVPVFLLYYARSSTPIRKLEKYDVIDEFHVHGNCGDRDFNPVMNYWRR